MSRKTQKPALGTKSGKRNRIQSISAVLATLALASGLAACTSASASDESEAGNADGFGSVTVQLSWLKNHEFAGFLTRIMRDSLKRPVSRMLSFCQAVWAAPQPQPPSSVIRLGLASLLRPTSLRRTLKAPISR